jgi:hypothetical protein
VLAMACEQSVRLYVSAHTHVGYWKQWQCPGSSKQLVELNVGSIIDSPTHFRTLALYLDENKRLRAVSSYNSLPEAREQAQCLSEWFPASDDKRHPHQQVLSFKWLGLIKQGRRALLRGLEAELLEYRELITRFPSTSTPAGSDWNDGSALAAIDREIGTLKADSYKTSDSRLAPELALEKLRRFEDMRAVKNSDGRRLYKVCLAAWAADIDARRASRTKLFRGDQGDWSALTTDVVLDAEERNERH